MMFQPFQDTDLLVQISCIKNNGFGRTRPIPFTKQNSERTDFYIITVMCKNLLVN